MINKHYCIRCQFASSLPENLTKVKSRKDNREKKELANLLFQSGETQKSIAERVGVSQQTMMAWVNQGGWREKRAASTITRSELINKTLKNISDLLEDGGENADQLSKLASLIEKLDKKNSPILIMDVFVAFGRWLETQAPTNKDVELDFVKKVTRYQDAYITEKLSFNE